MTRIMKMDLDVILDKFNESRDLSNLDRFYSFPAEIDDVTVIACNSHSAEHDEYVLCKIEGEYYIVKYCLDGLGWHHVFDGFGANDNAAIAEYSALVEEEKSWDDEDE